MSKSSLIHLTLKFPGYSSLASMKNGSGLSCDVQVHLKGEGGIGWEGGDGRKGRGGGSRGMRGGGVGREEVGVARE